MSPQFNINDAQVRGLAEALKKKIHKRAVSSLRDVFDTTLIPQILNNLMRVYDSELASAEPNFDPARPSAGREEFKSAMENDLRSSLQKSENFVSVAAGNTALLNYDKAGSSSYIKSIPKNPSVFDWLIFYLEGFVGEYAFITEDTYKKFFEGKKVTKKSLEKFSTWGWFGEGFMIEKKVYFKQGLNAVVPFSSIRHPFSGLRPTKLFERAMDGIDMQAIFTETFKRAIGN